MRPHRLALQDSEPKALWVARQISDMITAEKNRRRGKTNSVQAKIDQHIEWLKQQLKEIERGRQSRSAQSHGEAVTLAQRAVRIYFGTRKSRLNHTLDSCSMRVSLKTALSRKSNRRSRTLAMIVLFSSAKTVFDERF